MNRAYKRVISNKGSGGVDKMNFESLRDYLVEHKDDLIILSTSITIDRLKRAGYILFSDYYRKVHV